MKKLIVVVMFVTLCWCDSLNLTLNGFPARLNPLLATDTVSSSLADWLFEGLVKYDKNGAIVGEIAKSWRFVDETTLLFELRKDYRWHDGAVVSARDAVFTYETAISDRVDTPYTSNFRLVKSVEAIDDFTLKVTYKKPYFKALEIWMMPLLPKHILENDPDLMTSKFNTHPIGNSYYRLDELILSRNVELKRVETYSPHAPYIEKVIFEYSQDHSVEFLKLKSRQIHIGGLDALQLERQIDDDFKNDYLIAEYGAFGYSYIGFNLKNPKFQDSRVRKALSLAIDRQELIDVLFFGHGIICDSPIVPNTLGFNELVKSPAQDIEQAKALLKEAGYDETNPLVFDLTTNTNNQIRLYAAEIIQDQLAKAGVRVNLRAMEWQAFLTRIHARKFETVLLAWSVPLTPDLYTIWHSAGDRMGGFNFVGYHNDEVDRLIEEAEATIDKKQVAAKYREISRLIVEDNPYLFLYAPNSISAISRKIAPLEITPIGFMHNRLDWRILP
ncbi:MAG: peptide-binding protein [Helicobacteraceae bacterium]|jgi:peptide/nickel transport system substrate-binding protein|nr:peptide-binding protein [Helicobacteraceae bacterium]